MRHVSCSSCCASVYFSRSNIFLSVISVCLLFSLVYVSVPCSSRSSPPCYHVGSLFLLLFVFVVSYLFPLPLPLYITLFTLFLYTCVVIPLVIPPEDPAIVYSYVTSAHVRILICVNTSMYTYWSHMFIILRLPANSCTTMRQPLVRTMQMLMMMVAGFVLKPAGNVHARIFFLPHPLRCPRAKVPS